MQRNSFGMRLTVDRQGWTPRHVTLSLGDSICVSGVCLTLAAFDDCTMAFDVIAETLRFTTLGDKQPGSEVNLEPSLSPSTPMGGHMVQGHVDGVGNITAIESSPTEWRVTVTPPRELMEFIVPKGSITVDGISLTVASVTEASFDIALIPTTLDVTTLGKAKVGDRVNLETDIVSRTIVYWLRQFSAGASDGDVTLEQLRAAGFAK
jgi:riboflavin synthase